MKNIIALLITLVSCQILNAYDIEPKNTDELQEISNKNFQLDFLHNITKTVNTKSKAYLNNFLESLQKQEKYSHYQRELNEALISNGLEDKLLAIKQLLDTSDHNDFESFYALRNANFLKKLKEKFSHIEQLIETEMRDLRWYELCKQFQSHMQKGKTASIPTPRFATNQSVYVDVLDFGRRLYERVKISGSAIIDDYLNTLRKLLMQVVDETDNNEHTIKSTKILTEIDSILATTDFYEKRQRLYTYLQGNLAADYEQFQSTQTARDDLEGVLEILRQKSWDLVVNFVFSNAEFLEHLHEEWHNMLPVGITRDEYRSDSQILHDVHSRYVEFKRDHESNLKYESYIKAIRFLIDQVQKDNEGKTVHVYELLNSASQNIGSTTLNMMRKKCEEF